MKSFLRGMVVGGVLLALLSGCVTETVGGKEPEADPDAALELSLIHI